MPRHQLIFARDRLGDIRQLIPCNFVPFSRKLI